MAETIGSTINRRTSPTSTSFRRRDSISLAGSNTLISFSLEMLSMKWTRSQSAPETIRRGTKVSLGSSSPLQIITFPASALLPSGQLPPDDKVDANERQIVVFPVPGAPPMRCIFPAASQFLHSQSIDSGVTSLALTRFTVSISTGRPLIGYPLVWKLKSYLPASLGLHAPASPQSVHSA